MCRPLSGYAAIINDAVKLWISERTDSHTEIASEFQIRDNGLHGIYAFEFFPRTNQPSPDTSTWILMWDSDATFGTRDKPGDGDEQRMRAEIERAARRYVFTSGFHSVVPRRAWAFGDASLVVSGGWVEARGNSRVVANGGSVFAMENSRVEAANNAYVKSRESAIVIARGWSRVVASGNSRVRAFDGSAVTVSERGHVNACGISRVTAHDRSTVIAYDRSRVEALGDSRVEALEDSSVAARVRSFVMARGHSVVTAFDSAGVDAGEDSTVVSFGPKPFKVQHNAVWIDRTHHLPQVTSAARRQSA